MARKNMENENNLYLRYIFSSVNIYVYIDIQCACVCMYIFLCIVTDIWMSSLLIECKGEVITHPSFGSNMCCKITCVLDSSSHPNSLYQENRSLSTNSSTTMRNKILEVFVLYALKYWKNFYLYPVPHSRWADIRQVLSIHGSQNSVQKTSSGKRSPFVCNMY